MVQTAKVNIYVNWVNQITSVMQSMSYSIRKVSNNIKSIEKRNHKKLCLGTSKNTIYNLISVLCA